MVCPIPRTPWRFWGRWAMERSYFVVIPSQRAKVALVEKLMGITGYRHPTAGDVWILDQAQSLALVEMAGV